MYSASVLFSRLDRSSAHTGNSRPVTELRAPISVSRKALCGTTTRLWGVINSNMKVQSRKEVGGTSYVSMWNVCQKRSAKEAKSVEVLELPEPSGVPLEATRQSHA